ncbi:MAG TPA: Stf0 family sulfotransferase [Acidimicrobiales bacterium]|nr:Stf0 family sulfotransferase [Acidimicrobiales bacterium]
MRERLAATGKRFYCICFSARCGSTLLCDDLAQWGLGSPNEYFQLLPGTPVDNLGEKVLEVVEQTPGRFFGFKISWQQMYELTRRLEREREPGVTLDLRTVFPELRFVRMVRRDKVAQAVSSWRAESSQVWHWPVGTDVDPGRPEYDFDAVKERFLQFVAEDWLWESHFEELGVRPLVVCYEDYLGHRSTHLRAIADYLGADVGRAHLATRLNVMRDGWTEQMVERASADLRAPYQPDWVARRQPAPSEPLGG